MPWYSRKKGAVKGNRFKKLMRGLSSSMMGMVIKAVLK
jgi:hypothetical protein